ncbi:MAG: hypothetical protein EZS28_005576 [Streblomastix strix]|uniref:Uncharacterized protein n=1 Tax=Streblomastix strix TaxID=222440 RepID=A0A5J4WWH7_9EUKA|nr:MAG: hypothetical protein EZS28_005576 [Streblomastix strix]
MISIKQGITSTVTISQTTFSNIQYQVIGSGAAINAELYYGSILKVTDQCTFYNCSTQQSNNRIGGAIKAVVNGSNSQFIVSDQVKFEKCQSFTGGAISVELLNMGTCEVNNVQFKECTVNNDGGGIYAQLRDSGGTLTIINQTSFVQCINTMWGGGGMNIGISGSNSKCIISDNVMFEKCEADMGSAIYLDQRNGAIFEVHNCQFVECISGFQGGSIHYQLWNYNDLSSFILDRAQFTNCSSQYNTGNGGSLLIDVYSGTTSIDESIFSGSQGIGNGGAINIDLYSNSALIINNGIFTDCGCSGPGRGGAIAINQQQPNCYISITNSSFTNCKTLPSSSTQYGWGGAIYIDIQYNPPPLTTTNFQLTDLSFTNCKASGAGNNLHILSDDTTAIGNQIKTGSLLTVKDMSNLSNIISDLYTNEWYCFDYMGINKSKANSGNALFTDHEPLFISPSLTPKFNDPYLVDAEYGKDHPICGNSRLKCYTIKYILNIVLSIDDYPSNPATINIELQTNTQLENGIMIDSNTPIGNNFKIRSSGYITGGTDYIKRQIQTSSFSSSLFTISGTSHLELFGLHFDNINPTSINPLISLLSDNNEQNPQLSIIDCEFESDAPDSQIYHSIISINGGTMKMERAKIESYKLMNDTSVIYINQGAEEVFILNNNLRNILKNGENIRGIIELSKNILTSNDEQQMNARIESSSFIQPNSTISSNFAISSPFIYATLGKLEIISCLFGSEDKFSQLGAPAISIEAECSKLIISNTNFTQLLSGGIQLEVGQDSVALIESCLFMNCRNGSQIAGAAHTTSVTGDNLGSISITNNQFISCQGQEAGGIVFGDSIIFSM